MAVFPRPCSLLMLATSAYAFQLGVATTNAELRRHPHPALCQLDFEGMRTGELRSLLKVRGVSIEGCFDRASLVERADQQRTLLESEAPVPVPVPPAWPGGELVEQARAAFVCSACAVRAQCVYCRYSHCMTQHVHIAWGAGTDERCHGLVDPAARLRRFGRRPLVEVLRVAAWMHTVAARVRGPAASGA